MLQLSIVIPVYNNSESLRTLVAGIDQALGNGFNFELVLVDDGSKDGSWEIIKTLIASRTVNNPLKGIKLLHNTGQENAKMAGLRAAQGQYIVFMDADCQHDPSFIPHLISECEKGADVCYANFRNSPINLFKRAGSALYNYLACKLLLKPKGIYLSSYNVMRRSVADKVKLYEGFIVNIDAMVLQHTQKVAQITTEQKKSLNSKTNYTPLKMVALFFKLLPGFSVLPLRIILFTGILFFSAGLLFSLIKITFLNYDPSSIFVLGNGKLLILITAGILLTALGITGEYLGKIYILLNNSTQYQVQTIISSGENEQK
ncbi:MAG TPA: glycosyltransferase family 2 protein [Bacteroidia bacterium]